MKRSALIVLLLAAACASPTAKIEEMVCSEGDACAPSNPCATAGRLSCPSTGRVCLEAEWKADGASCGDGKACHGGECRTACTPGVCGVGIVDPATQQCLPVGYAEDGSSCGPSSACFAGSCIATRTLTGTRRITWWLDDGSTDPTWFNKNYTIGAVTQVNGRFTTLEGTVDVSSGAFTLPGVPPGRTLLEYAPLSGYPSFFETTLDGPFDLGEDHPGRPRANRYATTNSNVYVSVAGLTPWTPGQSAITIVSSGGDSIATVFDSASAPVGSSATSATGNVNWYDRGLIDTAAGDVVFVYERVPATISAGPALGWPYLVAGGYARLTTGAAIADGAGGSVNAFLSSPVGTATLFLDWKLSAFESLLSAVNPSATGLQHIAAVAANPHRVDTAGPLLSSGPGYYREPEFPVLLSITRPYPQFADVLVGDVAYPAFLDSVYKLFQATIFSAGVSVQAPGAAAPATIEATIERLEPLLTTSAPATPLVGPPTAPTIGGASAFAAGLTVGTTPTFAWSAPAVGFPTSYKVTLWKIAAAQDLSTTVEVVAELYTRNLSIQVPPGLLIPGSTYVAGITARQYVWDAFETNPFRRGVAGGAATCITARFTP